MTPAEVLERIQRLLLSPVAEWNRIEEEGADVVGLYQAYILPLAGIAMLGWFIGASIIGDEGFRTPFFEGLMRAIVSFGAAAAGVYAMAVVIHALAPQFGAQDEFGQAFKLAAFFPTPGWIGTTFLALPSLWFVALIGWLYSLYLLYLGLPKLMKPAADKSMNYLLAAVGCSVAIGIVVSVIRWAV